MFYVSRQSLQWTKLEIYWEWNIRVDDDWEGTRAGSYEPGKLAWVGWTILPLWDKIMFYSPVYIDNYAS
jgi:hypothetical protein